MLIAPVAPGVYVNVAGVLVPTVGVNGDVVNEPLEASVNAMLTADGQLPAVGVADIVPEATLTVPLDAPLIE